MANSVSPSRLRSLLGFIKWLAFLLSGLFASSLFFVCAIGVSATLFCLSSEPVTPYDDSVPVSEYDGKLICLPVKEIYADGQGASDSRFGVSDKGLAVCLTYREMEGTLSRSHYNKVHGIQESVKTAPVMRCKDFELKLNPEVFSSGEFLSHPIAPKDYSMPEALKPYVLKINDNDVTLQAENEPGPTVNMSLYSIPSPLKGDFYLMGRVRGNVLDATEPEGGFIRGAEAAANMTHRFSFAVFSDIDAVCSCLFALSLYTLSLVCFFVKSTRPLLISLILAVLMALSSVLLGSAFMLTSVYMAGVGYFAYMAPWLPWCVCSAALLSVICLLGIWRKAR